ncbi:MAG: hypothetical protein JRF33_22770 [Deltaproteobacteria bacterium]|nr:hypothetical protein [Deltaproteobacteria bacterium]
MDVLLRLGFLGVVLSLLMTGCPDTYYAIPCQPGDCEPNGFCVDEPFRHCVCDEGYIDSGGRVCFPEGPEMGDPCSTRDDCGEMYCYRFDDSLEQGYCLSGCWRADQCVLDDPPDNRPFCCVIHMWLGGGYCVRIQEGYECGLEDQRCGRLCVGQLESACDDELRCIRESDDDPDATCSHACETDEDCLDCWCVDEVCSCQVGPFGEKVCLHP